MSITRKLREMLDGQEVEYEVLVHPTVYTAQELAAATHISGKELAKVVMIKTPKKMVIAVLPATRKVDLKKLAEVLGEKKVSLCSEDDFASAFPDCEIGAQPPFGNLYELDLVASELLWEDEDITFNAGTHHEAIKMHFKDWEELAKPQRASFTLPL